MDNFLSVGTLPPPNPQPPTSRLKLQRQHNPHLGHHLRPHRLRPFRAHKQRDLRTLVRPRRNLHLLARQNNKSLGPLHRPPPPHPLSARTLGKLPRPLYRPRPAHRVLRPHIPSPLHPHRKNCKSQRPLRESGSPKRCPRLRLRRLHNVPLAAPPLPFPPN